MTLKANRGPDTLPLQIESFHGFKLGDRVTMEGYRCKWTVKQDADGALFLERVRPGSYNLSPERRREIASKGGKAVPANKRSFSTHPGLAVEAGRKGGRAVADEKRTFSVDREAAALAGKKGGTQTQSKRRQNP